MKVGKWYKRPLNPQHETARPWIKRSFRDAEGRLVEIDVFDPAQHQSKISKMLSEAGDEDLAARFARPAAEARREVTQHVEGLAEKALSALVATVKLGEGQDALALAELTHSGRPRACEVAIFVPRTVRKSGLAHQLLEAADQRARDLGQEVLEAAAPIGGAAILKALSSTGFERTSEDKDEVFFEKRLSASTYHRFAGTVASPSDSARDSSGARSETPRR